MYLSFLGEWIEHNQIFHVKRSKKYDKEHTCYICNAIFTRIKSLAEHCLSAHNVDKPYQCSECKETFSSKRTFQFHITNTHEKSEYLCLILVQLVC